MSDASQYPVTELFGCQPGYPLNQNLCPPGQGYHNGIDYGCPTGTPIVVNGVTIGISGATGAVTGPHVHIGRWVNGKATNPGVGNGFQFNNAVVSEIGQDPTNGKFVALNADGARWVYLHMSDNSKVSVGQELKEEKVEVFKDTNDVRVNGYGLFGIEVAGDEPALQRAVGTSKLEFFKGLGPQVQNTIKVMQGEINDLQNQSPNDAQDKLNKIKQIVG